MKVLQRSRAVILAALLLFSLAGCSRPAQSAEEDRQQLIGILDDIAQNLHPGTAGSSLSAARMTADLIAWAANSKMDKQEAMQIMDAWLQDQSPQIKAAFRDQLDQLRSSFERIVTDGAADLLESAGVEKDLSNLSTRLKDTVSEILSSGGLDK